MRKLPHNSRGLSATLWLISKSFLWLTTLCLLLLTYQNTVYPLFPSFMQAKRRVLTNPRSPTSYYLLAKIFASSGRVREATTELLTASRLAKSGNSPQVLGASTSLLAEIQGAPKRLQGELLYWRTVVNRFSDYRDGYLQLSVLAYQLQRFDEARVYLQKALELDPNYPLSQKLQEVFRNSAEKMK